MTRLLLMLMTSPYIRLLRHSISDFTLMTTALRPHGLSYLSPSLQCASIDHAMYFHKPFRVDESDAL